MELAGGGVCRQLGEGEVWGEGLSCRFGGDQSPGGNFEMEENTHGRHPEGGKKKTEVMRKRRVCCHGNQKGKEFHK